MTTGIPWYRAQFEGKKITLMGLGVLGRGVADALFLLECGAHLTITDIKTKAELSTSIDRLKKYNKQITWVLGKHRESDFDSCDMVVHASGVSLDNPYLKVAVDHGIPVFVSASLLVYMIRQHDIPVTVVGVTGSKGKTTTTEMIRSVLQSAGRRHYVGGNVRSAVTLPLIKKIKSQDILLLELDSWQLQGFGRLRISPDVGVFTSFFPDHMDYYGGNMKKYFTDKSHIFRHQKHQHCIVSPQAHRAIGQYGRASDMQYINKVSIDVLPTKKYPVIGDHMLQNLALAYAVGIRLGISKTQVQQGLRSFRAPEGRLQYLGVQAGVHVYNDNNSTTPDSTILSLQALRKQHPQQHIVWLGGGSCKQSDYTDLGRGIHKLVDQAVLFTGTGTDELVACFPKRFINYVRIDSMKSAFVYLQQILCADDVVVLSPGASSFGLFAHEYDRNDQFLSELKRINK